MITQRKSNEKDLSNFLFYICEKSWSSSKSCVFNLFNFQLPLLIAIQSKSADWK